MVVEIICVGTEILLGHINNTNAVFLAEQCAGMGLFCHYQTVVGDNKERIRSTVKTGLNRADIVVVCGGMGAAKNDLTREAVAEALGRKLIEDEHSREDIEKFYKKKGKKVEDKTFKQAMIPEGATVLLNSNGTSPGAIIKDNGRVVVLLPGSPAELEPMFMEQVVPYLLVMLPGSIYSKLVKTVDIDEESVEEKISDLLTGEENPVIATYTNPGEIKIRVTGHGEDEQSAKKKVKKVVKQLKERLGDKIYSTDDEVTLEKAVVDILVANNLTIATAESCTGGLLAGRLINVPGVSENFKTGFITYSNKSKRQYLGVKKQTLDKYGAVSLQTAEEMSKGVHNATKADVTVATTGIAGPDGGSDLKPVGLVYISCYVKGKTTTKGYQFNGNRAKVRELAVASGLALLRQCILEYYSEETFGKNK